MIKDNETRNEYRNRLKEMDNNYLISELDDVIQAISGLDTAKYVKVSNEYVLEAIKNTIRERMK